MATFEEKAEQFRALANSIDRIILEELEKLEVFIADLNRKQLRSGKDAEGQNTPNYKPSTGKTGRIKFFDTGEFYKSIKADIIGDSLVIESDDDKAKYLNPWKGVIETLGLSPRSQEELSKKLTAAVIDRIQIELL